MLHDVYHFFRPTILLLGRPIEVALCVRLTCVWCTVRCGSSGLVGLWLLRSSRNAVGPPMIIVMDTMPEFFQYKPRFDTKASYLRCLCKDSITSVCYKSSEQVTNKVTVCNIHNKGNLNNSSERNDTPTTHGFDLSLPGNYIAAFAWRKGLLVGM